MLFADIKCSTIIDETKKCSHVLHDKLTNLSAIFIYCMPFSKFAWFPFNVLIITYTDWYAWIFIPDSYRYSSDESTHTIVSAISGSRGKSRLQIEFGKTASWWIFIEVTRQVDVWSCLYNSGVLLVLKHCSTVSKVCENLQFKRSQSDFSPWPVIAYKFTDY